MMLQYAHEESIFQIIRNNKIKIREMEDVVAEEYLVEMNIVERYEPL
jgi:hypothetical protein